MEVSLKECAGSSDQLLLKSKDGECCLAALEPASSKDTNTLDRSTSPRNSKSIGTVSQQHKNGLGRQASQKDTDAEDVSLSSFSDAGKPAQRASAEPCTPHGRTGSHASNHSRLPSGVEDTLEADSRRFSGEVPGLRDAHGACSGSDDASQREVEREEIGSRSLSADRDCQANDALQTPGAQEGVKQSRASSASPAKGLKRPRSLKFEEDLVSERQPSLRVKTEPNHLEAPGEDLDTVFVREASMSKGKRSGRLARTFRGSEESLSRACSAAPFQDDEIEDEAPLTPRKPARKAARSKPGRRQPLVGRRSSRVAALDLQADGGEADEDYVPPGEAEGVPPATSSKRGRATRQRSAALVKPCSASAVAPTLSPRAAGRLRWNNSGAGCSAASLLSPMCSRRLRSQPLDVSCLIPDAFAFEQPAAKRTKHSVLQSGLRCLQRLEEESPSQLTRSKVSGLEKPCPAWHALNTELRTLLEDGLEAAKTRHAADFKLLEGESPTEQLDLGAAAERLGPGRLGKAFRAAATAEAGPSSRATDCLPLSSACRHLMSDHMRSVCDAWEERLNSPCLGVLGEPTTCLKARTDRHLQNTWEDLLSRHALELGVTEEFLQQLSEEPQQEDDG